MGVLTEAEIQALPIGTKVVLSYLGTDDSRPQGEVVKNIPGDVVIKFLTNHRGLGWTAPEFGEGYCYHILGNSYGVALLPSSGKQPRPTKEHFKVKGYEPKLVLTIGCKEYSLVGFNKLAARARRSLARAGAIKTDDIVTADVRVSGEPGITPADIDGLLEWLRAELKKV